jgi:hypothetical protein
LAVRQRLVSLWMLTSVQLSMRELAYPSRPAY